MRRNLLFLVATTSLFGAAPSFAQDALPTAASYDWTGFYVGVFGGAAFGEIDGSSSGGTVTTTLTTTTIIDNGGEIDYGDFDIDDENFLGGFQAGYDLQRGNLVFGIVGDIMKTQIKGSEDFTFNFDQNGSSPAIARVPIYPDAYGVASAELDWLATLRAKLGYAMGSYLFFVTGGVAWGEIETEVGYSTTLTTYSVAPSSCGYWQFCDEDSDRAFGYTVGAGVAANLSRHMFAEFSYLFVDLGEADFDFDFSDYAVGSAEADFQAHLVRFGLNWRF